MPGFDSGVTDPRWGFEQGIVDALFVPELPGLAWDINDPRRLGHAMRESDEINGLLEVTAERYGDEFGTRPISEPGSGNKKLDRDANRPGRDPS